MTEQIKSKIKFRGNEYSCFHSIFPYQYESKEYPHIEFPYETIVAPHTALRRGFRFETEVIDGKLMLTDFFGYVKDLEFGRREIEIADVVKNAKLPLFVGWLSRQLTCYLGEDLSLCDELHQLHFVKGLLVDERTINKRKYFRNFVIRSILHKEMSTVQLSFEHSKGCFREIRGPEEIFWIESFSNDEDSFETYDEIGRDAVSVTMRLNKGDSKNSEEFLVKTLLDEGKMLYSIDNGKSWLHLNDVIIKRLL